ncbi:hypothetical protein A3B02_01640 [Candidatus Roizmanbacteria bacterium RIFCSPLOWO2_01_FULL_42_14]|uniref:POTRA domain-containing protein n=3 Tax=Candidatus Roizmaniibacteriota TaxID=1752723 RepID=A0A1F7J7F5_9BACT|nr:MAG: hypothetical protein A3D08_03915 [Candidatus Roizmanbacteria bacterium RIFCSPHIGHO2_02_FULL_43_11]OGK38523.1 MAG: hypothetical protein A3F32_02930 [Candidatus Roizmanbacteria bacterium RIFCSPHIGHO2_12_FULL_42_10]OGK51543.1 MAG: hypothetical protein A3B02_01640 [Candidatus Roizmanbacteria bacterium RIFCSPLOWO2_01_FULL_42_14]
MSRKRKTAYYVIFLILTVIVWVMCVSLWNIFRVKNILIEGVRDMKGIQPFYGKHMFFLAPDTIKQNLIVANPSLIDVIVEKHYPQSLYIAASKKRPAVIVMLADGLLYLSDDGTVLEKNKQEPDASLPFIRYYQPLFYNQYAIGEKLDISEIHSASVLTAMVLELGIRVRSIDITNENMILLRADEFDIVATSQKDVARQFQELEYTYKQLRIGGKKFTSIDIRFEKPVIKLI